MNMGSKKSRIYAVFNVRMSDGSGARDVLVYMERNEECEDQQIIIVWQDSHGLNYMAKLYPGG